MSQLFVHIAELDHVLHERDPALRIRKLPLEAFNFHQEEACHCNIVIVHDVDNRGLIRSDKEIDFFTKHLLHSFADINEEGTFGHFELFTGAALQAKHFWADNGFD